MARVGLKGMEFYAFHGFYEKERRIGNNYILDVMVDIDLSTNPDDLLENTFNYEEIYTICNTIMKKKYKLLETVCHDIADHLKSNHSEIQSVHVKMLKLNPPIKGKIHSAVVEMSF